MAMTFGSLFAGIGGFDLGLERAGMECRWQVEIDPFCRRVLEKHWPNVKRYEDVREVGENLERVDLICGGFPCQDISDASRGRFGRTALEGARSGLWFEMLRVVCHVRPRFVLVENVPALLRRGMGTILSNLAALGFDAEWDCLPASLFGAPHKRERIFLVAYAGQVRRGNGVHHHAEDAIRRDEIWRSAENLKSGVQWKRWLTSAAETLDGQISTSDFCRMDDGLSEELDGIGALGNAILPQIAEWIGRGIIASQDGGLT